MVPLAPGELFGPFRILACAGRGGMGEVYKAEDTRLTRIVALKTIRADVVGAATERALARFEREAQMLASFSHPNVVTLFAYEDIEGVRTLVMERCV